MARPRERDNENRTSRIDLTAYLTSTAQRDGVSFSNEIIVLNNRGERLLPKRRRLCRYLSSIHIGFINVKRMRADPRDRM